MSNPYSLRVLLLLVVGACSGSASHKNVDASGPGGAGAPGSGNVSTTSLGTAGARADSAGVSGGATSTGGSSGSGTGWDAGGPDATVGPDVPSACVPFGWSCVGDAMALCNRDGTAIAALVPCETEDACSVQGAIAKCSRQNCQVAMNCRDGKVIHRITCFDVGLIKTTYDKEIVVEDCAGEGLICGANVKCVPKICEPNTRSCKSKTVTLTCNSLGDQEKEDWCMPGDKCVDGACRTPLCTPNQPVCDGSTATVCSADGTKFLGGRTDCAEAGKLCYLGACVDCWPTTYFCSGATVRHCAVDGRDSTLSATCTSTQACDPVTGTCKDKVCTPGKPACNGDTATTCNEDGSGYVAGGTPCADTGKHCNQGACAALACLPSTVFCSGKNVQRCSADGQSSTVIETCGVAQNCDPVTLACKNWICTPGQAGCAGNSIVTCNEDGTGHLDNGPSCPGGSGGLCSNGKCTGGPVSCQSGKSFCYGNARVLCYSNGWGYTSEDCGDLQSCNSETGACVPRLCIPHQDTCKGNTKAVCSADGLGYAGESESCGARYCVDGTCRDNLFIEDFEDANLVGWAIPPRLSTTAAITATYAAAGTRYALVQSNFKNNSIMKRVFPMLQPKRISWWAMVGARSFSTGTLILRSSSQEQIAYVHFHQDGFLMLGDERARVPVWLVPYAAMRWYHFELRNLDYTAKTFDFYVNDTLVQAACEFEVSYSNVASGLTGLELSSVAGSTVYWDEITFD